MGAPPVFRTSVALAASVAAFFLAQFPGTAAADPPTSTTNFQVPVAFVSACSTVGFRCWVPYLLASVTPSATTGTPGVVTFAANPSPTISVTTLDCIDVSVNWRNLTTGAAGATVLRAVRPDFSRPVAPNEWCRYEPTTVVTESGTVTAIADVTASVLPPASDRWPQIPVNAGFGIIQVS
jgi:hypothetical protein